MWCSQWLPVTNGPQKRERSGNKQIIKKGTEKEWTCEIVDMFFVNRLFLTLTQPFLFTLLKRLPTWHGVRNVDSNHLYKTSCDELLFFFLLILISFRHFVLTHWNFPFNVETLFSMRVFRVYVLWLIFFYSRLDVCLSYLPFFVNLNFAPNTFDRLKPSTQCRVK